jgi:hypothetical protein
MARENTLSRQKQKGPSAGFLYFVTPHLDKEAECVPFARQNLRLTGLKK